MLKYSRFFLTIVVVCGICLIAAADRGGFVKKNKAQLNVVNNGNLKNSIVFTLRSQIGSQLSYKESFLMNQRQIGNAIVNDALISYKKGNTIYLLPYKQKMVMPQYTQAEGYKLIIRSRK